MKLHSEEAQAIVNEVKVVVTTKEFARLKQAPVINELPMIALKHRCLWSIYHFTGNYELAIKHAAFFYTSQNLGEAASELESKIQELGYTQALKHAADNLAGRANNEYFSSMRVA